MILKVFSATYIEVRKRPEWGLELMWLIIDLHNDHLPVGQVAQLIEYYT